MDYSVVKISGKQYRVSPGQTIAVDRLVGKAKDRLEFNEVMLKAVGGKVKVGQPYLKTEAVSAEILEQFKDAKVRVFKFKAKSRYRKTRGHRQEKSRLKIVKI